MAAPSVHCMFDEICKTFKIDEIRDNQRKAILAVINGHDVFVGTRTGSGKSLTYECLPIVRPKSITLVIAQLVTIMSEQCSKLERLGFRATYIGKDHSETENIKRGMYDFVFGSPEIFVGDVTWREVLKTQVYQEKLKLIVVEEAHTVLQWGESDDEDDPFRVWFSKIGELRSLYSSASIAALTATSGPVQRRKIMKLLCFQANSTIILESPDRKNIKISSQIKYIRFYTDIFVPCKKKSKCFR